MTGCICLSRLPYPGLGLSFGTKSTVYRTLRNKGRRKASFIHSPFRVIYPRVPALRVRLRCECGCCRYVRLRGGRPLRGAAPEGLVPLDSLSSPAGGTRAGYGCLLVLLRPAKRTAGRRGVCGKNFCILVYDTYNSGESLKTSGFCTVCRYTAAHPKTKGAHSL